MGDLEVTSTGVPFLDSLLGGGFLSNSIIVISHQPGSKIRHLGLQIGLNKFEEKFHLINVTFHYSLHEVTDWVKVYTTNPELYKKVKETSPINGVSTIDCFNISESEEDSKIGNVYYVSNPFNIDNLLSVMAKVRESIPKDQPVYWVFYHLTNMNIGVPENNLIKFCRRAFRYHKLHGDLAFYYLNENAHSDVFFAKLYQLSDVFFKVIVEETPSGLKNGIQVIKGVFPFESKKVFFDINEKGEIQVITNKQDIKPLIPTESLYTAGYFKNGKDRGDTNIIKTGIPTLDMLLGGGILSNSMVVTSNQYGVRILKPLTQILQSQLGEKNHIININYHFSPQEYELRFKMLSQRTEVQRSLLESFSQGNVSIIDCLNIQRGETKEPRSNVYPLSNPFDVDKLLSVMTKVRNSISEEKSVFWIFSTLTDMSIGLPEDDLVMFCRKAFRYHKHCGDLALYTLTEQAHSKRFQAMLYQLSDVFIKFTGEETQEGIDTSLQILKGIFNFSSKKTRYVIDEKGQIQFLED